MGDKIKYSFDIFYTWKSNSLYYSWQIICVLLPSNHFWYKVKEDSLYVLICKYFYQAIVDDGLLVQTFKKNQLLKFETCAYNGNSFSSICYMTFTFFVKKALYHPCHDLGT